MVQQFQFHFYLLCLHHNQFYQTKIISISCSICLVFNRFGIKRKRITSFISVIISQNTCFLVIFAVCKQIVHWHYNIQIFCILNLYTIKMQLINGALFLNLTHLFLSALFGSVTSKSHFTTIYESPKSHKYHLLTLFRMGEGVGGGGGKKAPYQFFPCNFYKCKNYPPKLSDFQF